MGFIQVLRNFFGSIEEYLAPVSRNLLLIYFFYFLSVPFLSLPFEVFEVTLFSGVLILALPVYLRRAPFEESDFSFEGRWMGAVLLLVLLIGGVLRFYGLGEPGLWFDEAITSNAAEALLRTGEPVFPSGFVYDRALPHIYVVAASFKVFGVTEFAGRLPSAVFGLLTVLAVYLLGKEVGDARVGLLAAVLTAFATWEVAWTRQARMYPMLQLLFVTGLYLLFRTNRDGETRYGFLAGFLAVAAFATQLHVQGYLLLPLALLYASTLVLEEMWRRRRIGRTEVLVFSVLCIAAVVAVASISSRLGLKSGGALDVAVSFYRDIVPGFLGPLAILAVPGAVISLSRDRKKVENLVLVAAAVVGVGVMVFSIEVVAARYLLFLAPIFFIWTSFSILYVSDLFEGFFDRRGRVRAVFVAGVFAVLLLSPYVSVTPQPDYDLGPNAPKPGFKQAYQYVSQRSGDVLVAGWTAPALFYTGEVDYWLPFSYTGRGVSIYEGRDLYAGATVVDSLKRFKTVVQEEGSGWVVLDVRAWDRQPGGVKQFIDKNMVRHEVKGFDGRVYSWGR
ncbi:MAG: hypothetical protein MAG715_00250 [Methanonatronarchaeales archaeon]|nr:hypothetical protein [Methanonatronarchaeales archaeon]